jgi:hypothetical protein
MTAPNRILSLLFLTLNFSSEIKTKITSGHSRSVQDGIALSNSIKPIPYCAALTYITSHTNGTAVKPVADILVLLPRDSISPQILVVYVWPDSKRKS